MNYETDIIIDPDQLDVEWLEQPRLMLKYTQHLARVRQTLDESKQTLDIAKAEADKAIREKPSDFGIEKVTEAVVANAILNERGYKRAYTSYLEAKFEVDMAQGAVNAFEHRKSALENLVRLHGQQYFAGPSVPRDLSKEWERKKQSEKVDQGIASKIHRREKAE